ncbi:Thaumatin-like protein [Dichanthelium oligosanthes]|uniref:Thaumatin-like protein n=1 Tax=Dichanthelium oligosanthes TaxID=888268 RepID=A0A1E5UTR7_9POAL|nr:Thaumatin-like protein [Dichanthelium oligosanthes]
MASPAASSVVFLLLCVFTAGASAATFTITNNCSFILWPAAIPVGGGLQVNPGQTWTLDVPVGTNGGRIWGRTGCSFNGSSGHCATGDCAGALSCSVPGDPPRTEAEFSITSTTDYYDISIIDGYNLAMDFSCSTGVNLKCREPNCPGAFLFPGDDEKVSECNSNSNFQVTFCP